MKLSRTRALRTPHTAAAATAPHLLRQRLADYTTFLQPLLLQQQPLPLPPRQTQQQQLRRFAEERSFVASGETQSSPSQYSHRPNGKADDYAYSLRVAAVEHQQQQRQARSLSHPPLSTGNQSIAYRYPCCPFCGATHPPRPQSTSSSSSAVEETKKEVEVELEVVENDDDGWTPAELSQHLSLCHPHHGAHPHELARYNQVVQEEIVQSAHTTDCTIVVDVGNGEMQGAYHDMAELRRPRRGLVDDDDEGEEVEKQQTKNSSRGTWQQRAYDHGWFGRPFTPSRSSLPLCGGGGGGGSSTLVLVIELFLDVGTILLPGAWVDAVLSPSSRPLDGAQQQQHRQQRQEASRVFVLFAVSRLDAGDFVAATLLPKLFGIGPYLQRSVALSDDEAEEPPKIMDLQQQQEEEEDFRCAVAAVVPRPVPRVVWVTSDFGQIASVSQQYGVERLRGWRWPLGPMPAFPSLL